jgi:hypothetical protein
MFKHVDFEVPGWGELASGPTAWPSYRDLVVSMGPVAYWRLGELSGTTAVDEMNNLDATYQGDPTLGQSGALARDADKAVACDGSGDAAAVTTTALDGATELTLALWAKSLVTAADRPLLSLDSNAFGDSADAWPNIRFDASKPSGPAVELITFSLRNQAGDWVFGRTASNTAQLGWHFYALTWTSGAAPVLYLDGQAVALSFAPGPLSRALGSDVIAIGRGNKQQWWYGSLDECAVWDQALTVAQIQQLYWRGQGVFQVGV